MYGVYSLTHSFSATALSWSLWIQRLSWNTGHELGLLPLNGTLVHQDTVHTYSYIHWHLEILCHHPPTAIFGRRKETQEPGGNHYGHRENMCNFAHTDGKVTSGAVKWQCCMLYHSKWSLFSLKKDTTTNLHVCNVQRYCPTFLQKNSNELFSSPQKIMHNLFNYSAQYRTHREM